MCRAVEPGCGRLLRALLDWLGPPFCRGCGRSIPSAVGEVFCSRCGSFEARPRAWCRGCASPLAVEAGTEETRCAPCRAAPFPFDAAASGGLHEGPLRRAVLRFKYGGDYGVLPFLRDRMLAAVGGDALGGLLPRAGALVPVPAHRWRRLQRGWDPVLELARELAPRLDLPLRAALVKVVWTPRQSRLRLPERRRNLRRAFAVRSPESLPETIVLIDDVLTTGTTASRCADVLKQHGVRSVGVLTAARAVLGESSRRLR